MRHFLSLHIIVCTIILTKQTAAQKITEVCVDQSHSRKTVKLNCGSFGTIVDVAVLLGNGTCNTPKGQRCYGKTASILVDYLNCYWMSNCVINWPCDAIITPGDGCSIIGAAPEFMVVSYKCFESTSNIHNKEHKSPALIDICTSDSATNKHISSVHGMSGIIRSHDFYPWDYRNNFRTCAVKLPFPINQKLVVSVQDFDLSEGDTLIVGTLRQNAAPGVSYVITGRQNIVFDDYTFLTAYFNFNVGTESNSGKGFFLCFKFTNKDDPGTDNACADFIRDGNIETVEPFLADDPLLVLEPYFKSLQTASEASKIAFPPKLKELPKRCAIKKTEKAKQRCLRRHSEKRKGKGKTEKNSRRKNKRSRNRTRNKSNPS